MTPRSRFVTQTQVSAVDGTPDRYTAFLSDDWNCPLVPHGGVVTAVALRAMTAALASPDLRLRSVTTTFVAQVRPGALEVDVEVLRRGRSMSQVSALIRNAGESEGHRCTAIFGRSRRGFDFTELHNAERATT